MEKFCNNYKAALAYLKEKQCGEAKAALWHPEIGDIDLVWGEYCQSKPSKGWGLKKIIEKHPEIVECLDDIIKKLPICFKNERRVALDNGIYRAIIMTNFENKPKTWLLTAFEIKRGDG